MQVEEDSHKDDCHGADINMTEGLHDYPNINRWFMLLQMSIKRCKVVLNKKPMTISKWVFLQKRVRVVEILFTPKRMKKIPELNKKNTPPCRDSTISDKRWRV